LYFITFLYIIQKTLLSTHKHTHTRLRHHHRRRYTHTHTPRGREGESVYNLYPDYHYYLYSDYFNIVLFQTRNDMVSSTKTYFHTCL